MSFSLRPTAQQSGASAAARTPLVLSARNAIDTPAPGSGYWQVTTHSPERDVTRTEWIAVTVIGDVMSSGVVPADLRRSLFAVLETVPGVDVSSPSEPRKGTTVLSMRQTGTGLTGIMIDTSTGSLVGKRIGGGSWTTVSVAVVPRVPTSVSSRAVVAQCTALSGSGMSCMGLPPDPS